MHTFIYNTYQRTPKWIKNLYRRMKRFFVRSNNPWVQKTIGSAQTLWRKVVGKDMTFISFADTSRLVDGWIKDVDRNVDVVVGVPRSGLIVANLLSLKLGKPLTTPDNIKAGMRPWLSKSIEGDVKMETYLLVDDSIRSGASMREAIRTLEEAGISRDRIVVAALIAGKEGIPMVDTYAVRIEGRRFFEWNMVHKALDVVADMDGVLCEDPPDNTRDNEKRYEEWLVSAKPYIIPTYTLQAVLTSRLEKYRDETEVWLKQMGVQYDELIMSTCDTREEQRQAGDQHKIKSLAELRPDVYWESSHKRAIEIHKKSKIPVLSIEEMQLLN